MSDSAPRQSFWDTFRLRDRYSCEKAIRNGGVAAFISAAVTGVFALAGLFINTSDANLAYLMDPGLMLDVVLIVVMGIFVFRKSRTASTLLVLYFVASKILLWSELGRLQGLWMSILFFLYFLTAMRATYIWHSSYRDAIPVNA